MRRREGHSTWHSPLLATSATSSSVIRCSSRSRSVGCGTGCLAHGGDEARNVHGRPRQSWRLSFHWYLRRSLQVDRWHSSSTSTLRGVCQRSSRLHESGRLLRAARCRRTICSQLLMALSAPAPRRPPDATGAHAGRSSSECVADRSERFGYPSASTAAGYTPAMRWNLSRCFGVGRIRSAGSRVR